MLLATIFNAAPEKSRHFAEIGCSVDFVSSFSRRLLPRTLKHLHGHHRIPVGDEPSPPRRPAGRLGLTDTGSPRTPSRPSRGAPERCDRGELRHRSSAQRASRRQRDTLQRRLRLHNCASNGYTANIMAIKNAGLRIRVERSLRDEFLDACRAEDKPAAQVIREFMREYVAKHQSEAQGSLFDAQPLEKSR